MRLRFEPDAEVELTEARDWYSAQELGLGDEFFDAIDRASERILERPEAYPIAQQNTRRVLLERFPYALYYVVLDDEVVVLACVHDARHPRRWQDRVRETPAVGLP